MAKWYKQGEKAVLQVQPFDDHIAVYVTISDENESTYFIKLSYEEFMQLGHFLGFITFPEEYRRTLSVFPFGRIMYEREK